VRRESADKRFRHRRHAQRPPRAAIHALRERTQDEDRWGVIHAFPGVTNAASNAICRALGFTLIDPRIKP
jgi:RimJ/RimL family protein N-acetyltransferase